jgi:L-threonylcarbamoyladenylate synthase
MPPVGTETITDATRDAIDRGAKILARGGLVAFPTETVYGLGGRALDPAALAKIFAAKGRPATHPLIAHVLGEEGARELAARWSPLASRLVGAFWPGPLTLVVPRASRVPLELTGGSDFVGLRAPSHPVARALLAAFGEPVAAPSANRYQTLSPTTAAHVVASLGDRVDLVIDGGPCSAGIESTVVDLSGDTPLVLRPGAIDLPTLRAVVPELIDPGFEVLAEGALRASPGLDRRHYAPVTRLLLAAHRDRLLEEARRRASRGERIALLLVDPLAEEAEVRDTAGVHVVTLGADPVVYARALFATLHALDEGGFAAILAEPVPASPPWRAVADRLRRAGEPL